MKKYIIIILSLSLVILSACEDHLNLKPISYITSESFWTSNDDVRGALNGMYARMRNDAVNNFFIWGEARSEMMEKSLAGTLGYERYYDHSLSSYYAGPDWNNIYGVINICNLILKYTPEIDFTSEGEKNQAIAQAYAMRAFAYYTIVRIWGGVPLRTEAIEAYDPMTIQLPRTPKEQIFELIKKDIDEALNLFPDNNFSDGRNKWSKPATNALKADVYLWTAKVEGGGNTDLQTALTAINEIEKADVAVLDNYNNIFQYENKGNKEIIMAINFALDESGEMTFAHNMYMSTVSDVPAYVPQWQKDIVGTPKPGNGNVWRITKLVRDQFTSDDSRKDATFIDFQGSGANQYFTNYGLKYNGMVDDGGIRRFLDDWIIYRYADIILMKAEIKNALGIDPSEEINKIRQRAYGTNFSNHPFTNGTKAANDEIILKERLFELSLEGKRWWDLVRFGEVFNKIPKLYNREGEKYLLLWPISTGTLSREVLVEQTPGYE